MFRFNSSLPGFIFLMLVVNASWSLAGSSRSIVLEWDESSEADVVGYNVYRSDRGQAEYTRLNETLIKTFTYTDTTALPGKRRSYVVTAVDSGGLESSFSNSVMANLVCRGDVNGDGQRDILDTVRLLHHIVGNLTLNTDAQLAADVNESGSVDVLDSVRLLNHVVGNIDLGRCP